MLTNDELQRLKRYVDLAPYMDDECRNKLLETIRKLKVAELNRLSLSRQCKP